MHLTDTVVPEYILRGGVICPTLLGLRGWDSCTHGVTRASQHRVKGEQTRDTWAADNKCGQECNDEEAKESLQQFDTPCQSSF